MQHLCGALFKIQHTKIVNELTDENRKMYIRKAHLEILVNRENDNPMKPTPRSNHPNRRSGLNETPKRKYEIDQSVAE